jgi:hypothetical protein
MKYYNICTKQEWEENGVKRHKWLPIGTLRVKDDGRMSMQLNTMPNEQIFVFAQKPKEESQEG